MSVKLLIEHHLKFLSLQDGGRGSSESTLVKMSNCWKSHALALFSVYMMVMKGESNDEIGLSVGVIQLILFCRKEWSGG